MVGRGHLMWHWVGRWSGRLLSWIRSCLRTMDETHRDKAVELTRFELKELENSFVLLLLGSGVGIPAPPSFIATELLPYLDHELKVLRARALAASDSMADVVGMLDID